jgi:hypothetical protein
MSLDTDFNVPPYFDDFDEAKRYYRILFKPTYAVQARELTQSQTILQNQIQRFGDHVFRDGAIVEGCTPQTLQNLSYVFVDDEFYQNSSAYINTVTMDTMLVGEVSNVRAVPVITVDGRISQYPNTNRFYVKYLNTGANNENTFLSGETLFLYNSNQGKFANLDSNNIINSINVISTNSVVNAAVGTGYGFHVDAGIVYSRGFFQLVANQYTIVSDFTQNVGSKVIGFTCVEETVNYSADESLLDNALGYPNQNAPGADRLKLVPKLIVKNRNEIEANSTFFTVFEFSNITNDLLLNKERTSYDDLGDIFNERTWEESGDYVVNPFVIETIDNSTNTALFDYVVSSGKGYIHGQRVEYLASRAVSADRAITSAIAEQQGITSSYGNFVVGNQVAGVMNFDNFDEIDIYNQPFQAITNRLTPTLAGKTKVGTAKVIEVVHGDNAPGSAQATYNFYLTDIQMLPGYSFATHAKSLYSASASSGSLGTGYADIANSSVSARLFDSADSVLVFPFNKTALKTLRSGNGAINDTAFVIRNTSVTNLQNDGTFAVTIPSSATGGRDQMAYSIGEVSENEELDFIVTTLTTAISTSLGTATVSGTTVSATNIQNYFGLNDYISFNNSAADYRRVIAVGTNSLTIDSAFTNGSYPFNRCFPAGGLIGFNDSLPGVRFISVTTPTTFRGSVGLSGATLTTTPQLAVQYRIRRTNANQIRKIANRGIYVRLFANTVTGSGATLGLPDVFNIRQVLMGSNSFPTSSNNGTDVTNYFSLDSGQRDYYYDHARLVVKPQFVNQLGNTYLTVVLDSFTADYNNGIGFFSVDSYPTVNGVTNSSTIAWTEIPTYKNYDLRDSVDFRAVKQSTAVVTADVNVSTINPPYTNNFVSQSTQYLSAPDELFEADIEYYLGRIDLVTMNVQGGLGVVMGTPSENPRKPQADGDVMIIAYASVPPFPTLTTRSPATANKPQYAIKTTIATNRVYTMKDIGILDARIGRLEYYATLTLLESQASNIQVPDANGINRFKNGIFADPMSSHVFGATTDLEYRWCIDMNLGYGRPLHSDENVDLQFLSNTSSVVQTGKSITLPYTSEAYIIQPFATKYRNNTQDAYRWSGSLELFPNYDMGRDESFLPAVDASIDLTQPFLDFANVVSLATGATIFGTRWGDWRTTSSSTSTQSEVIGEWNNGWAGGTTTRTTSTTTEEQLRNGSNTFVVPISRTQDLGTYVTDIAVQPFLRPRTVGVIGRNLKPNTRLYAFFDYTPVSEYCSPGVLNTSLGPDLPQIFEAANRTGNPENVVRRTGAPGTPIISDSNGRVFLQFDIPPNMFRIGDRQLQLIDSDSLIQGDDAALTRASAAYTGSNISVTKRQITLTTSTPTFETISLTDNRTVTSVQQAVSQQTTWIRIDPLAQSFFINAPEGQPGVFVTKLDLFFKSKDPVMGVDITFCATTTGAPDSTQIFSKVYVPSSQINISDDASLATTITLPEPTFFEAGKLYAFYISPEAGSPNYDTWVSELGDTDVLTGAQVSTNALLGDLFHSSNAKTFEAYTTEDMKFTLYVANFTVGSGTAFFVNENDEFITYNDFQISNSSVSLSVGDSVWAVNSAVNTNIVATSVTGILQFIDNTNNKLRIDQSNGGWKNGDTIGIFRTAQQGNSSLANTATLIATANVQSVDNRILDAIVPRFATIEPFGTTINISFTGTSNSGIADGTYYDLQLDLEREMLDYERVVFSKSNELSKSLTIQTVLNNTNKYISPVIDLNRKAALVIQNITNNSELNEIYHDGSAVAKYIGSPIVLADGQDSEDLRVYLSSYRPYNTDVQVWVRMISAEDPDILENKPWTKMVNTNQNVYSSSVNPFDWREYLYSMPTSIDATRYVTDSTTSAYVQQTAWANPSNFGIVQYADSSGAIYQTYKSFAIKIVLLSAETIFVPKVNDMRGISLQV